MRAPMFAALGAAALLLSVVTSAFAHEGHNHADEAPAAPVASTPRGDAHGDHFEIVAVARGTELLIYLDSYNTNEPVDGATIEAETPAGPAKAAPHAGQTYRIDAPWLAKPGKYDLIFTVTHNDASDILPITVEIPDATATGAAPASWLGRIDTGWLMAGGVGALLGMTLTGLMRRRTHATAAVAALAAVLAMPDARADEGHSHGNESSSAVTSAAARERAQRLPDGTLFVPKDTQRTFGIRTHVTERKTHPRSIELPGRIIADPNASGFVQSAVGGRLSPPPGGFPRLGTSVKQGDVLAYVTPPLQAIDVSDMRQRQGELEQQTAIVQRRVARYMSLVPSGAVSKVQLEEAQLELEGLKERRAALEKAKVQPEALTAPVDGIVAEGSPIAGQIAQSNAVIFQIIDPAKLWVEALSFNTVDASTTAATAQLPNGKTLKLAFQGAGLADRNQTIPVHFAIDDKADGVRVGQFVPVTVANGDDKEGIAIPRAAIVRSTNGQDFVYLHVGAERFVARPVRTEPLNGTQVLAAAGIEPGARIVVQGAELLDHIR